MNWCVDFLEFSDQILEYQLYARTHAGDHSMAAQVSKWFSENFSLYDEDSGREAAWRNWARDEHGGADRLWCYMMLVGNDSNSDSQSLGCWPKPSERTWIDPFDWRPSSHYLTAHFSCRWRFFKSIGDHASSHQATSRFFLTAIVYIIVYIITSWSYLGRSRYVEAKIPQICMFVCSLPRSIIHHQLHDNSPNR